MLVQICVCIGYQDNPVCVHIDSHQRFSTNATTFRPSVSMSVRVCHELCMYFALIYRHAARRLWRIDCHKKLEWVQVQNWQVRVLNSGTRILLEYREPKLCNELAGKLVEIAYRVIIDSDVQTNCPL